MRPSLFTVFGEDVPAYFTLLLVGFGLAIWLATRWCERAGLDREVMIDTGLIALLAGIVGSRLLHVVADGYFWDYVHRCTDPSQVHWKITRGECAQANGLWDMATNTCSPVTRDCFAWAAFWSGGLTYYGGLLLAVPTCIWFLHREKFPIWKVSDVSAAVIPLGLFWGRLGCFLGGCCFGTTTDSWAGMSFPAWSPASDVQYREGLIPSPATASLPVHPTQLYEALGCLVLFAVLFFWVHPRKRFDGMVLLLFLGSYAVLRFVIEFWRDDDRGGLLGLSTSQLIGVAVLAACAVAWPLLSKRSKSLTSEAI